eukprot:gene36722-45296_t
MDIIVEITMGIVVQSHTLSPVQSTESTPSRERSPFPERQAMEVHRATVSSTLSLVMPRCLFSYRQDNPSCVADSTADHHGHHAAAQRFPSDQQSPSRVVMVRSFKSLVEQSIIVDTSSPPVESQSTFSILQSFSSGERFSCSCDLNVKPQSQQWYHQNDSPVSKPPRVIPRYLSSYKECSFLERAYLAALFLRSCLIT